MFVCLFCACLLREISGAMKINTRTTHHLINIAAVVGRPLIARFLVLLRLLLLLLSA